MNKAKTFDLISKGLGDGYLAARNLNSKDLEALLVDSLAEDHRWDQQLDSRLEYFISLFELLHRLPFQRIYDALFLREKHLKGGGETNIFSLKILAYGYFVEKEELCFELMKKYLLTSTCWSDLLSSVVFEDFLEKKESQKAKNFVNFVAKILAKKAIECPEKLSKFFLEIMHRETWYVDEWTKNLKVSSLVTKEKEVPVLSSPKSLLEAYQEIDLVGYFCAIKVISKKEAKTLAVEKELFNDYLKKINDVKPSFKQEMLLWYLKVALQKNIKFSDFIIFFERNHSKLQEEVSAGRFIADVLTATRFAVVPDEIVSWVSHKKFLYRLLSRLVLKNSLGEFDLKKVKERVTESLVEKQFHETLDLLEIIVKKEPNKWHKEFDLAYSNLAYSFGRSYLLEHMIACDSQYFAEQYAVKCLFDCEPSVVEQVIPFVSLREPYVLFRLEKLSQANSFCGYENIMVLAQKKLKEPRF